MNRGLRRRLRADDMRLARKKSEQGEIAAWSEYACSTIVEQMMQIMMEKYYPNVRRKNWSVVSWTTTPEPS